MHKLQKELLEQSKHNNFGGMTLREVGELVGEDHPQKIKHHLDQLKRKGYLRERADGSVVRAAVQGYKFAHLPIMGRANCGEAMAEAEDQIDGYLTVSKGLIPSKGDLYVLKAVGDSMNRANIGGNSSSINEGDYVVVDAKAKLPGNGDYVVSIIDGAANVKRFNQDNNRVVLQSESSRDYPPIIISRTEFDPGYMIAGSVVEVIPGV